jgi:VCBS repeat-containing protein
MKKQSLAAAVPTERDQVKSASSAKVASKSPNIVDDEKEEDSDEEEAPSSGDQGSGEIGAASSVTVAVPAEVVADAPSSSLTGSIEDVASGGGSTILILGLVGAAGAAAALAGGGGGGGGGSTVTPVNSAPVFGDVVVDDGGDINAAGDAVLEEGTITGTFIASDVDGDDLTFAVVEGPGDAGAFVLNADGTFSFTAATDFRGTAYVTVSVSDGTETVEEVFELPVENVTETTSIDVADDAVAVSYDANADTLGQPDDFLYTDNSGQPTNAVIANMASGDRIQVSGASGDYSFTSNGAGDIIISYNNVAAGALNSITLSAIVADATVVVVDEASAEAAAGFDFFTALSSPTGGDGGTLDVDGDGDLNTAFTVAATADADAFTEDANVANNVRVTGFDVAADTITVSNAVAGDYSFSSTADDIVISYNNAGIVSEITLVGAVADASVVVVDEASAETAAGGDFFSIAAAGGGGGDPAEGTNTVSTDVGANGDRVALDASGAATTFTDDADVSSNVQILNFASGDIIQVTNAVAADYSYSSDSLDGGAVANDLEISFSDGSGVFNSIYLLDVIADSDVLVFNEATAVNAVGFDFINFG